MLWQKFMYFITVWCWIRLICILKINWNSIRIGNLQGLFEIIKLSYLPFLLLRWKIKKQLVKESHSHPAILIVYSFVGNLSLAQKTKHLEKTWQLPDKACCAVLAVGTHPIYCDVTVYYLNYCSIHLYKYMDILCTEVTNP